MAQSVGALVADLADWFHDQIDGDDPVAECSTEGAWVNVAYESGAMFSLHVSVDN